MMKLQKSALIAIALAVIVTFGAAVAPAPVHAQAVVDLPALAFPAVGKPWGCRWIGTCGAAPQTPPKAARR